MFCLAVELPVEELVRRATVMCWRDVEHGVAALRQGADVVMCPTSHCYLDYKQSSDPREPGAIGMTTLETAYSLDPVPSQLSVEERGRILGIQGNVWTERMATGERVEYMTFPRLCALAEVAWSAAAGRSWPDFRERLEGHLERLTALGVNYRHPEPSGTIGN